MLSARTVFPVWVMGLRQSRDRRGFTLIELLTVIAIIAVLALLLVPAFDRVRGKQRQVRCASNMRQIALAMLSYANANSGHLPPGMDTTASESEGRMWDEKLRPYLGVDILSNGGAANASGVLHSPSDPRPLVVDAQMRRWARSYAIPRANNSDTWNNGIGITVSGGSNAAYRSRHLSEFAFPERTVMVVQLYNESNYQFRSAFTVMDTWSVAAGKGNVGKIDGRYYHGDSNNFAFADGHVEAVSPAEINTKDFNRFRVF